jgi:transposase DDE domain
MKFRVVCFKISDNKYECLITNLPNDEFNITDSKELYRKRLGIETSFRELKYAIGLINFSQKKQSL